MLRLAAFLSFALVLPALAETGEYDFDPIKIRAGKEAFAQACARCHQPDAKGESYGPPLDNIAGRQAGTFMDYPYSEALSEAGFVWTDELLRAWMADNTSFLPGTKMRHAGITDPTVQDLLLAYLHSISMGE